jgi:hypothetical protein
MATERIHRSLAVHLLGAWALLGGAAAFAATIEVPGDQPTIAAAIAAAAPGDVIHVETGTYHERIDVPPGLDGLTIEGAGETIIEDLPPTSANLVRIRSNGVLFQDFILRGGNTAVRLDDSVGSTVRFPSIQAPRKGFVVTGGESNEVSDCFVDTATHGLAVDVSNSPFVSVIGISVFGGRRGGIRVRDSEGAYVHGNAVDDIRGGYGIWLQRVVDGTADLNLVQGNARDGMRVTRSPGILFEVNSSAFNGGWGFRVEHSPPIASVADLENLGNAASDNGAGDFRVVP